jgi:RluA family pseudouridine synthase
MENLLRLSSAATQESWVLPVLYEDEHLLALAKPTGLPVSPDPLNPERPSLTALLHEGIRSGARWAVEHRLVFLANAHRLDSGATGVLLFGRTKEAMAALANQFSSNQPHLTFAVLAGGVPPTDTFTVDAPLSPHPARPWISRVDRKQGKKTKTLFVVAERFERHTLLRVQPLTDRNHQIRAHLQSVRHPVVGDPAYSGRQLMLSSLKPNYRLKVGRDEIPLMGRVALHAMELTIQHPATNETLHLVAPLPKDFEVSLKYLRRWTPFHAPPLRDTPPIPG